MAPKKGRALVAEQGAHHVVDHRAADYEKQIMSIVEDRGVNLVMEMLANVNLAKDLTMLAPGGRVVVIGNRGSIEINLREAMAREAAILGLILLPPPMRSWLRFTLPSLPVSRPAP